VITSQFTSCDHEFILTAFTVTALIVTEFIVTALLTRNDISGARAAGCFAWMWGLDVTSFSQVAHRILEPEQDEDDDD
jgi:FtsH-binding integral membrane protein